MGYVLLFLFFLTWLNTRKIRKAVIYLARQEGYNPGMLGKILDIISDFQHERKTERKAKKQKSAEAPEQEKENA